MSTDYRQKFGADTRDVVKWPYPRRIYIMRALWMVVHRTIWKLCWNRVPIMRGMILRAFGSKTAGPVNIAGSAWIEMPWDLELGQFIAVGQRTHIYNLGGVSIGDNTVLSQDVYVCGGTHDYTDPTYPLIRRKITIGSYVWIGAGAFICPGVTIGDGAVVAARAVVTKNVEPWTIVGGNPARFIKKRVIVPRGQGEAAAPPSPAAEVTALAAGQQPQD